MRENREDVTEDRRDADLPPRFVGVGIPVFNSRFPRKKAAVFPHYSPVFEIALFCAVPSIQDFNRFFKAFISIYRAPLYQHNTSSYCSPAQHATPLPLDHRTQILYSTGNR
jgi:hypothetical protein